MRKQTSQVVAGFALNTFVEPDCFVQVSWPTLLASVRMLLVSRFCSDAGSIRHVSQFSNLDVGNAADLVEVADFE